MTDRSGRLPDETTDSGGGEVQEPEWDPVERQLVINQTQQGWNFQTQSQFTPRLDYLFQEYQNEFHHAPSPFELMGWDKFQQARTS